MLSVALQAIAEPNTIEMYQQAICRDPQDITAHFNLANELFKQKDFEGAIRHFRKTIELAPTLASAHYNLGLALDAKEKATEAYQEYRLAIQYNPEHVRAHIKIIHYFKKKGEFESAVKECKFLLDKDPTNREYRQELAQLYFDQNNIDQAIIEYRKAILLDAKHGQLILEYANTLNLNNSSEAAYELYQAIYETGTKSLSITYNIAYTLKKMGDYEEAIRLCKDIIAKDPQYAQAHFTLATSYLTLGDYIHGWKEYEWRWKQSTTHERTFKEPLWDGADSTGKIVYLHAEQGLGDTFQFIRYAKIAKEKGAHVIAAVQTPLVQIISWCPYIDEVIPNNSTPGRFDMQAALMTMPFILNTQEATIPNMHPYLFADPALVTYWKEKLKEDRNLKIGICWQGNPNYSTHFLRLVVATKSMRPAIFAPLGNIPGITLYSLQKDHAQNVDESLPEGFIIQTFDEHFDNEHGRFMDTAAVMRNLDLIITVDTATAHLAGGLGVPVWVLLPKHADWRWLLDRADTPWYPTMRLFRQTVTGNWSTVIDEVCRALEPLIQTHRELNG
jgi:tetratricopeptide (TPR) repeat protein